MHNGLLQQQPHPHAGLQQHHPAAALQQQQQHPAAAAAAATASAGEPSSHPQHQMTAVQALAQANEQTWLLMGAVAEQLSDLDRAQAAYEHALRHNPASISALTQVAGIARAKDDFGKAIEFFQRVLNISQDNGEIWGALGHCYLMMDDLQKAYTAYQQALYHLPNPKEPKLWYGIGILYDRYGSLEHAEDAFSSVLRMDPNFEKANEIYFRLGIIYKQQHKYPASLDCFKYILKNPPRPLTDVDIWFQIGHVYEQQKEFIYAKEAYERVLSENPEHSKVLQQLGWLYHQRDATFTNQEMAVSYLEKSLASDRSDAQTWYLLGRVFMSGQRYNKAYEYYQQAVYRDGRNPTFWCSIGVLYYQINQFRDALDAYSRAIRLNPYISEVWFDLGSLYESCNNQITDAIDAYGRALDLDPANPTIKTRLALLRNLQQNGGPPPIPPPPRDVHPTAYANSGPAGSLGPAQGGSAGGAVAAGPQGGRPGSSNPMMGGGPQQQQQSHGPRADQGAMPPAVSSAYHPAGFPANGPGQQHPPSRMTSPVAPMSHGRPDDRASRLGPSPMDVDRAPSQASVYGQQQQQQQRGLSGGRQLLDGRNGGADSTRSSRTPGGYPPLPSQQQQQQQQPYINPYPPYTSAPPGVHHPGAGDRPGLSSAEAEWERAAREKGVAQAPYGASAGYYPPPPPPGAAGRLPQEHLRRGSDERNGDAVGGIDARRGSVGRSPFHSMQQQQQPPPPPPGAHPYYAAGTGPPQDLAKSPGVAGHASAASGSRRYDPTQDDGAYRGAVIDQLVPGPRPEEEQAAGGSKRRKRAQAAPGEEKDKKPRRGRTSGPDGAEKEPKRRSKKSQDASSLKVTLSGGKSSRSTGPADPYAAAAAGGHSQRLPSPSRSDTPSIRGATPAPPPPPPPPAAVPSRFVDDNYDDDDVLSDTGGAADLLMGLAGGFSFSNSRGAPPPPPAPAPPVVSAPPPLAPPNRSTASTAPPLFPSPSPQVAPPPPPAPASAARSPAPPFASAGTAAISTLNVPASDERTTREDSAQAGSSNPLKRDHEDAPADAEAAKRPKIEEVSSAEAEKLDAAAPVTGSPTKASISPSLPQAAAAAAAPSPPAQAAPLPA